MHFRISVFLAVADNLSFTKAASALFISQPAVTKHIKELENQLGITLFERRGNRITLTAAGEKVYQYARNSVMLYSELEHELSQLKDRYEGSLRIGASSTISQYVVPEVLASFHTQYPDIKLTLLNGNSFEMEQLLIEGKIDMALVENFSSRSDLRYVRFLEDEIVAVAGADSKIARKKSLDLNDLPSVPLVIREQGSGTLEVIDEYLKKAGIQLNMLQIILHLGSTEAIKNFLIAFEGMGLVSVRALKKELQLNSLTIIPFRNPKIIRHFRIVLPKGYDPGFAGLFIQFLHQYNL
ncbi:MAG TPA: LysR family transcriptional regulator [Bacteroidales bacterium]|nr:LysR family transcriptional regulator [Bacteroidales bacterium]